MNIFNKESFSKFIENNIVWFPTRSDAIKKHDFLQALIQFEKNPYDYLGRNATAFGVLCKKVFSNIQKPSRSISYQSYLLHLYGYKQCYKCSLVLSKDKFFVDNQRWDKLTYYCFDCSKLYAMDNVESIRQSKKKYKQSILPNTPKWISSEELAKIDELYSKARELSKITGIQHDVDHIVPLKGKFVSGLHVLNNLQIIEHKINNKKLNYHESVEAWK